MNYRHIVTIMNIIRIIHSIAYSQYRKKSVGINLVLLTSGFIILELISLMTESIHIELPLSEPFKFLYLVHMATFAHDCIEYIIERTYVTKENAPRILAAFFTALAIVVRLQIITLAFSLVIMTKIRII